MTKYCASCIHLDWSNKERYSSTLRYYCDLKGKYVEPNDYACGNIIEDKNRTNNEDEGHKNTSCNFSLLVRDILGYDDDCELLTLFRYFRENVLKKNQQYLPILVEYDQLSETMSKLLLKEEYNFKFCLGILQSYLLPCAYAIKKHNNEKAITIFKSLWEMLKTNFELTEFEIDFNAPYNLETLGKGRVRQIKTSEI